MGIIKKIFAKKYNPKKDTGTIYKTPSEVAKETGGFVPTTDTSIPEVYSGTAKEQQETKTNIPTTSGGGRDIGGDNSKINKEIISQIIDESNKVVTPKKPTPTTTQNIKLTSQQLSDLKNINIKTSEIYDPRLRTYTSTTQRSGTSQIRQPTYDERNKLDTFNSKIEEKIFGEKKSENILTADTKEVASKIEELKKVEKELINKGNELSKLEKVNEQGEWTGSESELYNYNKKVDDYNSKLNRYNDIKDINVGILGYETRRDIREFDLKNKPITSTFKIFSSTAGSTAGGLVGDVTGKEKLGKGVGKVVEFGYDVGKYVIPVVGTGIFAGETIESVKESGSVKRYIKEKPIEAGMTLAFGGLLVGKEIYQAGRNIKLPSKTTSTTEQIFMKKYKTTNIPKVQKVEAQGKDLLPKIRKGGETTIIEDFNPITKIVTKGKRFKDVQRVDSFGNVVGETTKTSILGKLGNKYSLKYEYKSDLDLLKQDLYKNKKLIKSELIWNPSQKKTIGLTEMSKGNVMELKAKQVRQDKVRDIFSEKRTKYTQDYLSLEEGINVKGKQRIRVLDIRETTLEPAKKEIKVGIKSDEGEVGIFKEVKRETARLSKGSSFDLLKLNEPVAYEEMVGSSGTLYKSPRFSDIFTREIKSKGKFEITRETPFNRFVEFESRLLRSKRGQSLLEINKLDTRVNVPSISSNLQEVNKLNMIFPEVKYGTSNLGTIGFKGERLLKYQPNTKIDNLGFSERPSVISNVKVLEVERPSQDNLSIDLTRTFTDNKSKNKTKSRTKPREDNLFREVEKEKTQEVQIIQPKNLFKDRMKFNEIDLLKQRQQIKQTVKPTFEQVKVPVKSTILSRLSKKADEGDLFKVFVTKGGKEIDLKGEFNLLPQARKKLKEELKTTLRASGGIKKGGKKLSFSEIGLLDNEFIPSKTTKFKVVQRKEKRLGTRPETSEIAYFKKIKGSKSNLFNF